MQRKSKAPLSFMVPSLRWDVRNKLRSPNNLDWLLTYICRYIRDNIMRTFPPRDPPHIINNVVMLLGKALSLAVLQKLREYYPNDAHRKKTTLLQWYPDRAGELLNQALCFMAGLWIEDHIQHPHDSLVTRCQRLLPLVDCLPNMRGKSALGQHYQLFFLKAYEESQHLLKDLPELRGPITHLSKREKVLEKIFHQSPRVENKGLPLSIGKDLFDKVSDKELKSWSTLRKNEIALEMAVRAVKIGGICKPQSLHRLLPRLRSLARRVDRALNLA